MHTRRKILKLLSLGAGTLGLNLFPESSKAEKREIKQIVYPQNPLHSPLSKAITAITLGAGNRGNVYGGYALAYPGELDIIGVAEPIPIRNERYAQKHNIDSKNRFKTWEDVFKVPRFADAVIISTPDNLHYGPAMKALEMGYDVLLEKPISPSMQECLDILNQAKKYKRIVAVCHVLRYTLYFQKLKEIISNGGVGDLVSIQHFEPIEHIHMAHSFVRGNWHNSKTTTPIILAKSCHDLDILRWLVNKNCKSISAYGSLKWFRKEKAPQGSTARCSEGCALEATCPYSALKIYYRERKRRYVFDLPENKEEQDAYVLQQLKTGNYGRCVYRMENDQPDHYITSMVFDEDITASFSMEAFTSYEGRRTRIMGAMGDIVGDMDELIHTDFRTGKATVWKASEQPLQNQSGHGGGDWRLVKDFVQAVSQQNPQVLTSAIDASIESHVMGFMAEESRLNKKMMEVRL